MMRPLRWWQNREGSCGELPRAQARATTRSVNSGIRIYPIRNLIKMRFIIFFVILLIAAPVFAVEPVVHRDLPYVELKNERQCLDVYSPPTGKNHPVVFWIHG